MKLLVSICFLLITAVSQAKQVPLDTSASSIQWLGQKKIPGGDHKGTVSVKKGSVNFDKNMKLIGGTIIIDMNSIVDTDLSGKWKTKLEGHLNSEDFFHVSKHQEASFKITKVEPTRSDIFKVTGNLTIRGKTNAETFEIKIGKKGKIMTATGEVTIDRTKYGVTYNSEAPAYQKITKVAKDKIIKDEIQLTLNLATQKI